MNIDALANMVFSNRESSNIIPRKRVYAIDEQSTSEISYTEAEHLLLEGLGFSAQANEWRTGDVQLLVGHLMSTQRVSVDADAMHAVRTQGYGWRREVTYVNPETALYLDACARLNEIYTEHTNRIPHLNDQVHQEDRK